MANSIDAVPFPGLRSSNDWTSQVKPDASYREGILLFYPNGTPKSPLTALTSKLKQIKVDNHTRTWWEKIMPSQFGTITGVYTDSSLGVAYATPGTNGLAGRVVYAKMAAVDSKNFRVGHQVQFMLATKPQLNCQGKVIISVVNGTSSYVGIVLLNNDNTTALSTIGDCTLLQVIGNINPENSEMPTSVVYDPTKRTTTLQTFRTAFNLSRRAIQEMIRTGKSYEMAKAEAMMLHFNEMEWAFLFGVQTSGNLGTNGEEETTTQGLYAALNQYMPGNIFNYVGSGNGPWDLGSQNWLDSSLEVPFRYGSSRKFAFIGNQAVIGLQRTIRANTQYHISGGAINPYGLYTYNLTTPFGDVELYRHPLLTSHPVHTGTMLLFEPANLDYMYLQDTKFEANDPGRGHVDGTQEGWLTDCGLEFHLLEGCAALFGWGQAA